jgi:Glyoxalase-like domain
VSFRLHEITIDCLDVLLVAECWAGLLGGEPFEPMPGWLRLQASTARGPMVNFQPVPEPKQGKARVHLDLVTDDLDAAIARVIALGGRETGRRSSSTGLDYCSTAVVPASEPEPLLGIEVLPEQAARVDPVVPEEALPLLEIDAVRELVLDELRLLVLTALVEKVHELALRDLHVSVIPLEAGGSNDRDLWMTSTAGV